MLGPILYNLISAVITRWQYEQNIAPSRQSLRTEALTVLAVCTTAVASAVQLNAGERKTRTWAVRRALVHRYSSSHLSHQVLEVMIVRIIVGPAAQRDVRSAVNCIRVDKITNSRKRSKSAILQKSSPGFISRGIPCEIFHGYSMEFHAKYSIKFPCEIPHVIFMPTDRHAICHRLRRRRANPIHLCQIWCKYINRGSEI